MWTAEEIVAGDGSTDLDVPLPTAEEIVSDDRVSDLEVPLLEWRKKLEETDLSKRRIEPPTIFRVHRLLRNVDKKSYEPKVISFGPYHRYHRGNESLAEMEELKWLYLKKFLARNPEVSLEDYVFEIKELEQRARSCYSDNIEMDRDEFVKMMLLDGCFVVELLLARYVYDKKSTTADHFEDPIQSAIWAKPAIWDDMLMVENQLPFFLLERLLNLCAPCYTFHNLAMDMMISFFLYFILPNYTDSDKDRLDGIIEIGRASKPYHLLHLFYILVTRHKQPKESFTLQIDGTPEDAIPQITDHVREIGRASKPYHLLHLLYILVTDRKPPKESVALQITQPRESLKSTDGAHDNALEDSEYKYLLPTGFIFKLCSFWVKVCSIINEKVLKVVAFIFKALGCCRTRKGTRLDGSIPSATKLEDAGVKFMRKEKPMNFLDITFEGNVLEIPQMRFYDNTNCVLRNLIAFEQCCRGIGNYVSHYADFMDRLIDTPEDVQIVLRKEIIYNSIGSNEAIASLFNQMSDEVIINSEKSYLFDIVKDVNKFCNKRRNRWRAKLNRDYFSNPWAIISLIAAAFLLILTALQTVFGLLSYFNPQN